MMKKVRWLILLGLLMGTMALPIVQAAEPWDTIKQVVTLEPVMTMLGYTPTAIDPLEGLVRFLVLILMFAIFFAGAEMLKLGKGVSVTIAAVFALISAVFIPGPVLLAIGTSYATLISVALLAIPLLGLGSAFFMLKDHPKTRVVLMAVGVWVLYQMQTHIARFGSGSPIAGEVVTALTWITGLAWAGLIFSVIGWVMTWGGGSKYHPNAVGGLFDRFTQKTALGAFTGKGQELRHARIEETRLLNDLAVEQKEVQLLHTTQGYLKTYKQIAVNEFFNGQKCKSNNHFKTFQISMENLKNVMDQVEKVDHQWTKAERNEVNEMRRLVKEMASRGVTDGDRKPVEDQEKILLEFYIKGNKAVNKVLSSFKGIAKFHKTVDDELKQFYKDAAKVNAEVDLTSNPKLMSALKQISAQVAVIEPLVDEAVKAEEDASKVTIALAEEIKTKWLVK